MQTATESTTVTNGNCSDDAYNAYLKRFAQRFSDAVGSGAPLFTTNVEDLFSVYLSAFDTEDQRQYHKCHACRNFINRFGGLVTIMPDGTTQTPIWFHEDAPEVYKASVQAMAHAVRRAKVTGVFLSSDKVWGTPVTGTWTHLHVRAPSVYNGRILTAGQAMAEKREDYVTVNRAVGEFKPDQIEQALTLLETDALYRSERIKGPVQWLRDLYIARDNVPAARRANVTWLAVATAAPGFCHPRSSMAGTLLEDIAGGMDFGDVSRRFAAKMHPLQYQRPKAAPNAQNIAQGEKVIEAMGAQRALLRRFARLSEIEAVWRPAVMEPVEPAKGGAVFGHLIAKGDVPTKPIVAPPSTMTWSKFESTVLPTAEQIEYYTGHGRDGFTALVTAVDPDAPPIMQWDTLEKRNPVSWYVWHGGSPPEQWRIAGGAWHKISAVTLKPCFWHGANSTHHGKGVVFILADARETRQSGNALFPEVLKSEFHAIRSTIEAYSKSASIEGMEEGDACGVMLDSGSTWNVLVRVKSAGRSVQYRLDRWD